MSRNLPDLQSRTINLKSWRKTLTPDPDHAVGSIHPFRVFWETGDLDAWIDALDPDVELHSPLITSPFRGREPATELYAVLLDALDDFEVAEEFSAGNSYACFWQANAGGRRIEGADLIRSNSQGKIAEVRVLVRPLVSLAAFASCIGPPLAAKQGRLRAVLVRLFNLPLKVILTLTDVVAPRLVVRR
jgi:hypothetical protein